MNEKPTILLIGEAATGKTNYISRFWLAAKSEDYPIVIGPLSENIEYILTNANDLLQGNFAGRTNRGTVNEIIIPIKFIDNKGNVELIFPDLSGEDIRDVFYKRSWDGSIEKYIANCEGVILFIRMNSLHNPPNWLELGSLFTQEVITKEKRSEILDGLDIDPDNLKPPTQTNLVEWLQFLCVGINETQGIQKKLKVSLIIAAWDEIAEEYTEGGPDHFLAKHTPLLDSFLRTNEELIDFKVFGVSIVGGDLTNDQAFKKKYLEGNPLKQGYVVYDSNNKLCQNRDITLPVAWILGTAL